MASNEHSLKAQIIELSDAGLGPETIRRTLGCDRRYLLQVISRHSVSVAADIRAIEKVRQQTRELGRAIIAAGCHQSMPEMKGIYR